MRRRPAPPPSAQQMIREYLGRVSVAATKVLPKGDRLLFVGRTRAAIEAKVGPLASADADDVRSALTTLGDPEDLAKRERERLYSARRRGAAAAPTTLWKPSKESRRGTAPSPPPARRPDPGQARRPRPWPFRGLAGPDEPPPAEPAASPLPAKPAPLAPPPAAPRQADSPEATALPAGVPTAETPPPEGPTASVPSADPAEPAPEEPAPGGPFEGELVPGEPETAAPNGASTYRASTYGASPDGASRNGVSPDGAAPDEASRNGASRNEASRNEASRNEASPDEASRNGVSPDGANPDGASPDEASRNGAGPGPGGTLPGWMRPAGQAGPAPGETTPMSIVPGMAQPAKAEEPPAARWRSPAVAPLAEAWALARKHPLEAVSLVLLGIGGLILPFPFWLIGGIVALKSRRWDARDKWMALAGPPLFTFVVLLIRAGTSQGNFFSAFYQASRHDVGLSIRAGCVLCAAYLIWRLRRGPRLRTLPPWQRPR